MDTEVSRGTYSDQIADRLLEFVNAERLRPGDLLPSANELANRFQVSRPVVREALKTLQGQGLIELIRGKGAVVRPVERQMLDRFFERAVQVDDRTILELLEIRRALEIEAAAKAAESRTPDQVEVLGEIVDEMRRRLPDDLEGYADLDLDFHVRLTEVTGNEMLGFLVGAVRGALRNSMLAGLTRRTSPEELAEVQRLHEALYGAIQQGDQELARRTMAEHFDVAATVMKERGS